MTLELSVCVRDGYAVPTARRELDVTSSAGVKSAIAALTARHPVVIVELSAVEFMDCGVLGALLRVQRLARQGGGDVLLAAPVAMVLRLLGLTGMEANRAPGAPSDFPERARYPGIWTATVPGYADG